MIIYYEKELVDNMILQSLQKKFVSAHFLPIDHYKNLFDKNRVWVYEKTFVFASVNKAILPVPYLYGHPGKGFFLKNSLNCVYDCKYCYLKGAFKNHTLPIFFINYDDIKTQILQTLQQYDSSETLWFYSSDYSDNLATDTFTHFTKEFIPFFDTLSNAKMEIRTKSTQISGLLALSPSKNVEIAFSLNPQEVIAEYEWKTPQLQARLDAIQTLLAHGWQVGIRFLPLLEIENYQEIYKQFLEYVVSQIDFSKIYSVFIGGLLYTKDDYNKIIKKEPLLDLLYKLEDSRDGFMREKREVRDYFYNLFDTYITKQNCNRCLDT